MTDDVLIPVAEIFGPTIGGEGENAGVRMHFLRVGGCDMLPSGACTWCDSMHAVTPSLVRKLPRMSQQEIFGRILALPGPTKTITISGGNPCLYDLGHLVMRLRDAGWTIWVETQGTIYRPWMNQVNVTVSPKPPSAGRCDIERLEKFMAARPVHPGYDTVIKIPVDPGFNDGADLNFASMIFERADEWLSVTDLALSVVTYPSDSTQDVIDRWRAVVDWAMTANIPDVRVLPQLHVLLWGHARGV